MRGKLETFNGGKGGSRITPADAGKTQLFMLAPRRDQDHPRGCGENCQLCSPYFNAPGSPPRMRGKLRYNIAKVIQIRITPADAGKTGTVGVSAVGMEDHPRGCGENVYRGLRKARPEGSPPRMRGKLPYRFLGHVGKRITPADAGKTARASRDRQTKRDHPRGCGENTL